VSRWGVEGGLFLPASSWPLQWPGRQGSDSRRPYQETLAFEGSPRRENGGLVHRTGRPEFTNAPISAEGWTGKERQGIRARGSWSAQFTKLLSLNLGLPPFANPGGAVGGSLPGRTKCRLASNQRVRKQLLGVPHAQRRGPGAGPIHLTSSRACWRQAPLELGLKRQPAFRRPGRVLAHEQAAPCP